MRRKTRPEALTVGETMVMVAPPAPARICAETSFMLRPGGAESNVAIHLARMGHRAEWAGLLGADAFAAGWLSGLLRGADPGERLGLGHAVAAQILQTTFDDTTLPESLGVGPQAVGGGHRLTFD